MKTTTTPPAQWPAEMAKSWEVYRNPDKRCTYPWSPGKFGYCWSFALHVDGVHSSEHMAKICPGCECWDPKREVPT